MAAAAALLAVLALVGAGAFVALYREPRNDGRGQS